MCSNKINYFIRNILLNSKINREKFVQNKRVYNVINSKKNNLSNRRNFGTFCSNDSYNKNNIIYIVLMISTVYYVSRS